MDTLEENAQLREIVEKHVFNQMALCSSTLRDLRKIRGMADAPAPFEVRDPRKQNSDYRIQW
jgi:hypothetical protein